MSLLTREELKRLSEEQNGSLVSFYMPMRRAGPETRQNPIRLKNLIDQAESQLVDHGIRAAEARQLLQPAQELVDDYNFWQNQSDGLALFLAPGLFRTYRLPLDFEELVVVSDRFHLKPLMPLLSSDGRFYLLAISQNQIRLFEGGQAGISEVDLEDVPTSLAEALRFDDPEKQHQFHTTTATPGGPGGRPAQHHGQGVAGDEDTNEILRYFHQVDEGIQDFLAGEQRPLVLAGVDYLFPIYQEANTYPHLLEEGVIGNPDEKSAETLHQEAWNILQSRFEQAQQEAVDHYYNLSDTEQISGDIRQIVPAAYYRKVDTLFVAVGRQQWGLFDPGANSIELHAERQPGDEDLLDAAAVQTLLYGGLVYAVEPAEVPGDGPLAAIYRYEA